MWEIIKLLTNVTTFIPLLFPTYMYIYNWKKCKYKYLFLDIFQISHIGKWCCHLLHGKTREPCSSAVVDPTRQLYRTFHREQAFLRGVTIGWDLAWFHYARNNVFSRLRLVISWRVFRLVGSTTEILRTGLAQRTRTTGNGWWYCSPICNSNSSNLLIRKDTKDRSFPAPRGGQRDIY